MDQVAYEQFRRLEDRPWWLRGRRLIFFDLLDRLLPRNQPIRSLDVGCGYGAMVPGLSRYGPASGIDVSLEAVEACRRRGIDASLSSAYEVPEQDESYDVLT